jgi:Acetoacetate decarboxylase (ADC)
MALLGSLDPLRTRVATSAGDVKLPILYEDASAVLAFFHVQHRRAAELLARTPLAPVRFARGAAVAAVVAYDYRSTSVGPYRELGTALAVVPRSVAASSLARAPAHHDVGWYVLDLPGTSPAVDAGGRELWGFPKFTAPIDVDLVQGRIVAVVQAPAGEEPIVKLEGYVGSGVTLGAVDMILYTLKEGELLRTIVETRGQMHSGPGHGLTLRAGCTHHPMANRVVALGLDGACPFAAQVCREYRAILNAAAPFHTTAWAA